MGPYTAGVSTQRPPDFRTWMMLEITRRSSTCGLPRVLLGRWGAILANCSSVNQNWSMGSSRRNPQSHHAPALWVRTLGCRVLEAEPGFPFPHILVLAARCARDVWGWG